jgi:hypothetical protein
LDDGSIWSTCHYYPPALFAGCCSIPARFPTCSCGGASETGSLKMQFVLQRATIQGPSMLHPASSFRFAAHFILAVGSQSSDMMVGATSYEVFGYRCRETALGNCCSSVMPAVIRAATCMAGKPLDRTQAAQKPLTGCAEDARNSATPPKADSFAPAECYPRLGTCRARDHFGHTSLAPLTIRGLTRFSGAEFTGPFCPSPYARD